MIYTASLCWRGNGKTVNQSVITDRLIGKPLSGQHVDEWNQLCADPAIARWITVSGCPLSAAEANDALHRNRRHWETHGFGLWMFYDQESKVFVGRAGLRTATVAGRGVVELAYALLPPYWGRGYATEMGSGCLRKGLVTLGLEEIWCYTLTTNLASQKVIRKLGFQFVEQAEHVGLPHVFYRLTVEQWRQQTV